MRHSCDSEEERHQHQESDCVQYAIAVASDPDGYEGMAFCRWTADIIGNGVTIDWEKLE